MVEEMALCSTWSCQLILWLAPGVSNEGGSSPLLVPLPAVSWPWVSAWGSLEPPRRDGENAQKTRKNGEEMAEIWPKTCEQGKDRRDQLDTLLAPGLHSSKTPAMSVRTGGAGAVGVAAGALAPADGRRRARPRPPRLRPRGARGFHRTPLQSEPLRMRPLREAALL